MSERKLVDFESALEDLAGEKELYKELLDMWFSENQFDRAVFDKLMQKENKAESASYVHRMKGAVGALGAEKLFDAAQQLEDILRGKNADNTNAVIENVFNLYKQTNEELTKIKKRL